MNEAKLTEDQKTSKGSLWEIKINPVTLASVILSLAAIIISYNVAYGQSELELKPILGLEKHLDLNYYNHFDKDKSIDIQFIIRNKGYGSTVYVVDPVTCLNPPHCLPNKGFTVSIRYNDEEKSRNITHADFKSIGPKSSHLIEVLFSNITKSEMPDYFTIRVQDYITGKELWLDFIKSPIDYGFIINVTSQAYH